MSKPLPHRPNLDHLRRQAKSLLAGVRCGNPESLRVLTEHWPAARNASPDELASANIRLADAQFTIARSNGFGSWPKLAEHVALLRSLEGTWAFDALEVDGAAVPEAHTRHARIVIDGDRFRTEAPEAIYEGVFNIDADASPAHIDIEFYAGPEAGNWNHGIFRIDGDRLEICLDMKGQPRPTAFATAPGRGHAYEVLRRESGPIPAGGIRAGARPQPPAAGDSACAASVNRLVPFVHVVDVQSSIEFYGMLGFSPAHSMADERGDPYWALARSAGAEIMLARASGPIDAEQQAVLFYMYSPDLRTLRSNLIDGGLRDAGPYRGERRPDDTTRSVYAIAHPEYMKQGEVRIVDPDGYVILVGQTD